MSEYDTLDRNIMNAIYENPYSSIEYIYFFKLLKNAFRNPFIYFCIDEYNTVDLEVNNTTDKVNLNIKRTVGLNNEQNTAVLRYTTQINTLSASDFYKITPYYDNGERIPKLINLYIGNLLCDINNKIIQDTFYHFSFHSISSNIYCTSMEDDSEEDIKFDITEKTVLSQNNRNILTIIMREIEKEPDLMTSEDDVTDAKFFVTDERLIDIRTTYMEEHMDQEDIIETNRPSRTFHLIIEKYFNRNNEIIYTRRLFYIDNRVFTRITLLNGDGITPLFNDFELLGQQNEMCKCKRTLPFSDKCIFEIKKIRYIRPSSSTEGLRIPTEDKTDNTLYVYSIDNLYDYNTHMQLLLNNKTLITGGNIFNNQSLNQKYLQYKNKYNH